MVQNFTASSDRLIEAARHIEPKDAGVILSKVSQMQGESSAAEFARNPEGALRWQISWR